MKVRKKKVILHPCSNREIVTSSIIFVIIIKTEIRFALMDKSTHAILINMNKELKHNVGTEKYSSLDQIYYTMLKAVYLILSRRLEIDETRTKTDENNDRRE